MAEAAGEQDRLTLAEDGEMIITIGGAAAILNQPYNTVKQWATDGLLGAPYESAGSKYKRYSWRRVQEVATWRQVSAGAPPSGAVA